MAIPLARIYVETSVFGGVFDTEFAEPSRALFEEIRRGRFKLVVSRTVQEEIEPAPPFVKELFEAFPPLAEIVEATEDAGRPRQAYIDAGIVTARSLADALHVAQASVSRCAVIVSWNFKHIVHWQKIPRYNGVNTLHGPPVIAVHTPSEVLNYGEENC